MWRRAASAATRSSTLRMTSLTSSSRRSIGRLRASPRMRSTMSVATWLSSRTSRKISLRSAAPQGFPGFSTRRCPASALATIAVSGCLMSCTIEAVSSPTSASRAACMSSTRNAASSRSACLSSVTSRQVYSTVPFWIATRLRWISTVRRAPDFEVTSRSTFRISVRASSSAGSNRSSPSSRPMRPMACTSSGV